MLLARAGSLWAYLAQVPDPRGRQGRRHSLAAMLAAVVCGVLCGARGCFGLAEWLHDQDVGIWHWLGLTRRSPKGGCFRDLLKKLDPACLEAVLRQWVLEVLQLAENPSGLAPLSLDGKTLCATLRPYARAVHLLALNRDGVGSASLPGRNSLRSCRLEPRASTG